MLCVTEGIREELCSLLMPKSFFWRGLGRRRKGVGGVEAQGVVGICLSEPLYCISQLQILNTCQSNLKETK